MTPSETSSGVPGCARRLAGQLGYRLVGSNVRLQPLLRANDVGAETFRPSDSRGSSGTAPMPARDDPPARRPAEMSRVDARPAGTQNQEQGLEQTVATRAFRGGLWQGATQIAPFAFTLVISIIAARILGPDQMGRQSYIAFIVVVGQAFLGGGLANALLRFTGDLVGRGREAAVRSLVSRCRCRALGVPAASPGGAALFRRDPGVGVDLGASAARGLLAVVPGHSARNAAVRPLRTRCSSRAPCPCRRSSCSRSAAASAACRLIAATAVARLRVDRDPRKTPAASCGAAPGRSSSAIGVAGFAGDVGAVILNLVVTSLEFSSWRPRPTTIASTRSRSPRPPR
jgi:hypothetical protein